MNTSSEDLIDHSKRGEKVTAQKLTKFIRTYIRVLLSWRSIITFGFCSFGVFLYYHISWVPLRILLTRVLVDIFTLMGHVASNTNYYLIMDGVEFDISIDCTYIDLILIGLAYMWRGDNLVHDLLRIFLFIVTVSVVNCARVYFAIACYVDGIPWKYAHDLVDTLIYYPSIVLIILFWLHAMKLRFIKELEVVGNKESC